MAKFGFLISAIHTATYCWAISRLTVYRHRDRLWEEGDWWTPNLLDVTTGSIAFFTWITIGARLYQSNFISYINEASTYPLRLTGMIIVAVFIYVFLIRLSEEIRIRLYVMRHY